LGLNIFPAEYSSAFLSPDSGTYPVNEQFGASFVVTAADPDTDSMVLTAIFGPTNYTFTEIQNIRTYFIPVQLGSRGSSAGTIP